MTLRKLITYAREYHRSYLQARRESTPSSRGDAEHARQQRDNILRTARALRGTQQP